MKSIFKIKSLIFLLITLCCVEMWGQPANDNPCNAQNVGLLTLGTPIVINGTNVSATTCTPFANKANTSFGYNYDYHISDVWYKFQLPNGYKSAKITLTTTSGKKFTLIQRDEVTCSDYTKILASQSPVGGDYYTTEVYASTTNESLTSVRTYNNCQYSSFTNGEDVYLSVGGTDVGQTGTFTLSFEVYGLSGGGCPLAPPSCGTVGFNWQTGSAPSAGNLVCSNNTNYGLKATVDLIAGGYIAPGFAIGDGSGGINYSKIEVEEGAGTGFVDVLLNKILTYCVPSYQYRIRLTGSGSGTVIITDNGTGTTLYSGAFSSGMIITLAPNAIKGTATFSGPGVSNTKLNKVATYVGSGYGIFNPSIAGAGTHTIIYSWNNGNGCSGTANINVTVTGLTAPSIGTKTQPTCATATGSVVINSLPSSGTWTLTATPSTGSVVTKTGTGTSTTLTGLVAGTYTINLTYSSCSANAATTVIINAQPTTPAAPTASVTAQPTCSTATGTISVTAPTNGTGITYTVTGTSPVVAAQTNATGTFAGLAAGTYDVTTSASGCTSTAISLTVNAQPTTPIAPTASVTAQPTCSTATGTITVTAPANGTGITYTVTGTSPVVAAQTNSTGTFSGLAAGTYSVTTATNGCASTAISLNVNQQPITPAAPTASVTAQPTCIIATGTITVTAPVNGTGITYTVTGTSPVVAAQTNSTGTFSGLAAGTYNVTTSANGCTSSATALTVNQQPINPATPTASVTAQPTCIISTGTITVTAPANGTGITYTITGTSPVVAAQTNSTGTFSGLAAGTYDVTTSTNGCTSTATSLTVDAQPITPAAPTASVTAQPTCIAATGTIIITAPANGSGVTYTVTGTSPVIAAQTNSTGTFSGLAAGNYDVTTTTSGCTSTSISLTVNQQPITPAAPTASATQPTCTIATGTITVTTPANGTGITYTVTGTSPVVAAQTNSIGTFSGLAAGTYDVTTSANGCTSSATSLTVDSQPVTPAAPIGSATQPTCTIATGTIIVTTPTNGTGITYTVTGTSPVIAAQTNSTGTFSGLAAGTYDVTTSANGCTSTAILLTVDAQPITPLAPTVNSPIKYCQDDVAVPLTALGSDLIWYTTANGTGSTIAPTPSTATIGSITYYVSQTLNTCESDKTAIMVNISNATISLEAGCVDTDYTLTATAPSGTTFEWYQGATVLSTTGNTLVVTTPNTYRVVATFDGCSTEATENVTSVYCDIPKGISPNGDGLNDTFDLSNLKVKKLEIFNRYGMEMYSKTNYKNEWGGYSDSGLNLPDGTYYYVIQFESGKTKTGWVYKNSER